MRGTDFTTGRGETYSAFDNLGRQIKQVENSNSLAVDRRTTLLTYRPDDQIETVMLMMRSGNNQTTRYLYGTTLSNSDIVTANLRTVMITPDGARTTFAYNRQGEAKQMTDPNGNVHRYEFDGLGRLRADHIVKFGRLTDRRVQRIQWDYDKHGRLEEVTSFASGAKALNGVRKWYTSLGIVRAESQNHFQRAGGGLDNHHQIIDPHVEYRFEKTALDEPRVKEMFYPGIILSSGEEKRRANARRRLTYHYDSARELNDALNRVHKIEHSYWLSHAPRRTEAEYVYGGVADVNSLSLPEVDLASNLGDYNALDQFSNLRRVEWKQGNQRHELLQHVHDLSRNRVARLNLHSAGTERDEGYGYDALSRLESFARGKAVVSQQGKVTIPQAHRVDQQSWQLDEGGNWKQFKWQESEGKSEPQLSHTRQHNAVNEITGISAASGGSARWAKPEHDAAGNMIAMPNPRKPGELLGCKYDAWHRLVEVSDPTRNVIAVYQYDGFDRRIVKQTKDSESKDLWRHFIYSPDGQVVEEREASKATELPETLLGRRWAASVQRTRRD